MAVAAYYHWESLGKPLTPAQSVREVVEGLKVAYPQGAAANLFSWYADEAHYESDYPEDHTPFSVTGWPQPDPQWWVCATDVMHRPDLGVDCGPLFDYWITSARAGLMPWLKYLIWQAKLYDVRNGWAPRANSGHYDHIHMSTRTDHLTTGLNGWTVVPGIPEVIEMGYITRDREQRLVIIADDWTGWFRPPGQTSKAITETMIQQRAFWKSRMALPADLWITEDGNHQAAFDFDSDPNVAAVFGADLAAKAAGGTPGLAQHTHDVARTGPAERTA